MKRTELKPLLEVVEAISELDPQMSLLALRTFLLTAANENINSMIDVRNALESKGETKSNIARALSVWSEEKWRRPDGSRPKGLGFLEQALDFLDHRRKLLALSDAGNEFCDRLASILSNAGDSDDEEVAGSGSEIMFELTDSPHGEFGIRQKGRFYVVAASAEDFTGSVSCLSFGEAKRVAYCLKIACEMPYFDEA